MRFVFFITIIIQRNPWKVWPSAVFWTSRNHRPLSPYVDACHLVYRAEGSAFPLLVVSTERAVPGWRVAVQVHCMLYHTEELEDHEKKVYKALPCVRR